MNTTNDIKVDMVNHPQHYQSESGLEVIDVIEAFTSNLTGIEAVCTANIIKYICRWKQKNGLEDLKKARWYLDHLIEQVEDADDYAMTDSIWLFSSRKQAEKVRDNLRAIVERYDMVTVNDVHRILNKPEPGCIDGSKYGWTDVADARIVKVRDGYMLDLPDMEVL